jgi:dipeptidyl aminopeptidase/acylaminoacyl peptidase
LSPAVFSADDPVSIPFYQKKTYNGKGLKVIRVLETNKHYKKYFINYRSSWFNITGIMNVPAGKGPFPVIITAHGYIDPKIYTTGRGLKREQDYLAKHGYVVLHPDYRNYNGSDKDPEEVFTLHLGYTEDVINAVYALKNSDLKFIDRNNIGLLGHSMGGLIGLNMMAIKPGLVKAYVLFAPMSMDYKDNFERWILHRNEPKYGTPSIAAEIIERYGSPETTPDFWGNVSVKNFIADISDPVEVYHGTADKSVPVEWSKELAAGFKAKEKDMKLFIYRGEGHEFIQKWPKAMRSAAGFFDKILKKRTK